MAKEMISDLISQYENTFRIFKQEVNRFTADQWLSGFSFFQVPVEQAMHLLNCLDFYFAEQIGEEYPWGDRFGGGWWELENGQFPNQGAILLFANELEIKVFERLNSLSDADLVKPTTPKYEWAETWMGHYIYALRHTLHHFGQLSALASYHGHAGGSWD